MLRGIASRRERWPIPGTGADVCYLQTIFIVQYNCWVQETAAVFFFHYVVLVAESICD